MIDELTKTFYGNKRCNDNISELLSEEQIGIMQDNVENQFQKVLDALLIDTEKDHNTQETAKRVAKMMVREVFAGRYEPKPRITSFPNANQYDELYLTGPIKIRSTCAHHFQPIVGNAWVGIFPGKNVIGLSKFNRLVDWVASRPQIQEEMTVQIADIIEQETQAEGVAVVVKAEHMCLTHRGVKEHESDMTTSVVRGSLRNEESQKREFFTLLKGMKGFLP
jgi:GTP cyclohydrolase I|tara:strand:- start:11003 stop:11668 length:666 start_codon:yes stop_codon:yes gene_type:complete